MDEAEKKLINGNLTELIDLTTKCDPLWNYFKEKNKLTDDEIQEIESEKTPNKRTTEFYRTIQKKSGAFPVLLNGLEESKKTGALSLLAGKPGIHLSLEQATAFINARLAVSRKAQSSLPGLDKIDAATD